MSSAGWGVIRDRGHIRVDVTQARSFEHTDTKAIASAGKSILTGVATYSDDFLRAEALPPFRPAAFFCAVVPPCLGLPPEPDFFPPRLEAPGEFAIRAARSLDIPLSLRASYCRSFLTLGRLSGMASSLSL
jgi:hypothetical protein